MFFMQKAADGISACLVGTEMCIGDRRRTNGINISRAASTVASVAITICESGGSLRGEPLGVDLAASGTFETDDFPPEQCPILAHLYGL